MCCQRRQYGLKSSGAMDPGKKNVNFYRKIFEKFSTYVTHHIKSRRLSAMLIY